MIDQVSDTTAYDLMVVGKKDTNRHGPKCGARWAVPGQYRRPFCRYSVDRVKDVDSGTVGADQLHRLVRAMVDVGSHLNLERVLREIVATATELVDAQFGALGVLDPTRTVLSQFITVGLDEETTAAIGERPKGHGILGMLIVDPHPIRLTDLNAHPDSYGFPPGHPPMTSFLGVPVHVKGEVFGNLYLTDKRGGAFTEIDEELAVGLSAAAGVAIDNARMHQRMRDMDVLEDRERIARDLHDTVIQRLFATGLSLQGASRLAETDPVLFERIQTAVDDLDTTVRDIRSAIFSLQPHHTMATTGLRKKLVDIGSELREALGAEPRFRFHGPIDSAVSDYSNDPDSPRHHLESDVVAVTREALTNIARHAQANRADVEVKISEGWLELTVTDDGQGPDNKAPRSSTGGHGLSNMATRAEARGGTCRLMAVTDGGSQLLWRVPLG